MATLLERIERRVAIEPDGCWLWLGYCQPKGYGQFKPGLVHRVAYETLVEPIPTGLELDHLCEHKNCCNPDHLEPVTMPENMRRQAERRAFCRSGRHQFTADNILVEGRNGPRRCRACREKERSRHDQTAAA